MPRGASPKREREYEELKERFARSGRYRGRQKEVAARIVNKQRAKFGETKAEKRKDRQGRSPDRDLPVRNYQHLTIGEVKQRVAKLDTRALKQIRKYEAGHKQRKTLLRYLDQRLRAA